MRERESGRVCGGGCRELKARDDFDGLLTFDADHSSSQNPRTALSIS